MKYSLQPDLDYLNDGDRIILKPFFKYSPEGEHVRLPAVVGTYHGERRFRDYRSSLLSKPVDLPHVVLTDGSRLDVRIAPTGYSSNAGFMGHDGYDREPMWTLPIPDVSDEEAISYARAFRGEGNGMIGTSDFVHEPNVVVAIDRVEGKSVFGRLVSWHEDTFGEYEDLLRSADEDGVEISVATGGPFDHFSQDELDAFPSMVEKHDELALSSYEISLSRKALPEDTQPGSIIVGRTFSCDFRKDALTTTIDLPLIAGVVTEDRPLSAWFPRRDARPSSFADPSVIQTLGALRDGTRVRLATVQDHLKEIARAKAKLLPDEAVVLVFPPEEGLGPSHGANISILGSRGATFFEDLGTAHECISHSAPEEGGLWIFGDANYWSHRDDWSGEWDGGLHGSWRPATDADLANFGLDRAQANVEAEGSYEEGDAWLSSIKAGTFIDEMMELAERVHSAEVARIAKHTAALSA